MQGQRDIEAVMDLLIEARALSTWGPDFNETIVATAWINKLRDISYSDLKNAIDKLSGRKEFPCPNDILEVARAGGKHKELPDIDQPWKEIAKQIVHTDAMQALKQRHLGDFHHVYDAMLRVAGILDWKPNFEMLNEFLNNPQQMVDQLRPRWRN